jgi:hypothetical protein
MMVPYLQFKDAEFEEDFLRRLDPRIRAVCYDLAEFTFRRFKKPLVVTCVNRPADKDSAHGYGRAVDIRSLHLAVTEKSTVLEYLRAVWDANTEPSPQTKAGKQKFLRAMIHVGTAEHLHLAINSSHSRGNYLRGTGFKT